MAGHCQPLDHVHRRAFLKNTLLTTSGAAVANLGGLFNSDSIAAEVKKKNKQVILLWMAGGASHLETFDMKPGRPHGGVFRPIQSKVAGTHVCEYLPNMAKMTDKLAICRGMSTAASTAAGHSNATYLMHTGNLREVSVRHPELGAVVAKYLGDEGADLPSFVQMCGGGESTPNGSPGILGAKYQPLRMSMETPRPRNLTSYLSTDLHTSRRDLSRALYREFDSSHHAGAYDLFQEAREKAWRLMQAKDAFKYEQEWERYKDLYGNSYFGRNCMIARKLIEQGVPFIEVEQQNYDTHADNFDLHKGLLPILDKAWSGLMTDLEQRGLLENTLIIWMGEMGRTPGINSNSGRDHFVRAWTTVLAGAGVNHGIVHGKTDKDGKEVLEGKVTEGDFFATIYKAIGIDPSKHHYAGIRPIPLTPEGSSPVEELLS